MKGLFYALIVIGVLICGFAVIGRFSGNPGSVIGIKTMNLLLLANTLFLFAIILKDLKQR